MKRYQNLNKADLEIALREKKQEALELRERLLRLEVEMNGLKLRIEFEPDTLIRKVMRGPL